MIGIFDSGGGGLSVWKELVRNMPLEDYFYVSDAAYCPYGPKSKEVILQRAVRISEFLIEKGAKIIVVACNTATAAAIDELRERFDIPFVGMEPAVKPAASLTKTGVIGVLATQGTFKGNLYLATSEKYAHRKQVKIIEQIGSGLVEAVESGNTDTSETEELVRKYVEPMTEAGADCIVLGCTHYPFLEKVIRKIAPFATVINPAPAVARRTQILLDKVRKSRIKTVSANTAGKTVIATTGQNLEVLRKLADSITDEVKSSGIMHKEILEGLGQNNFIYLHP